MRAPSRHARKKAQRQIDEILRLPDFAWGRTDGNLVAPTSWNVWAALGALTPKGVVAKRQVFVQDRVLTIYDAAIQVNEQQPLLKIDTDSFDEALHHEVSLADPDITKHVDASELGRILKLYAAGFFNREDRGDIEREKRQGHGTRFQLRQAAAQWEAVLRQQQRQKKKKDMAKGGVEEEGENTAKDEEDTREGAKLMDRLTVSEFDPARLDNETDAEYILRLQDKVRELRIRMRSTRGEVRNRDESIRKLKLKVEELREMEDEEDDSNEGPDLASSSPGSPWETPAKKRRRGHLD